MQQPQCAEKACSIQGATVAEHQVIRAIGLHPTPGGPQAPTSPGLTLAEHQAIRAIGLQHTPGPWQRIEWTHHAATTLVVPDATVATGVRVIAEFQNEADAALGEAAPDLLAALISLLDRSGMDYWPREQNAARAAIAKAARGARA